MKSEFDSVNQNILKQLDNDSPKVKQGRLTEKNLQKLEDLPEIKKLNAGFDSDEKEQF